MEKSSTDYYKTDVIFLSLKITGKRNIAEARALERCMREATEDPKLYFMKVDEVAASCLVMMGYK